MIPGSSHEQFGEQSQSPPLSEAPLLSPSSGLCGGPGQISCEEANEMIQMVLDHLSDSDSERMFNEHVGDCPPCESEFIVYERIVASLVRSRPRMPGDTASRIQSFCNGLSSGAGAADPTAPQDLGSDS